MQRTIPKRTFQAIALLTLLVPLGIWLFWLLRSSGPLPWLRESLFLLALLILPLLCGLDALAVTFP